MLQRTKHQSITYNILEEIFSGEYRTNLALRGDMLSYYLYSSDLFATDISIDMVRTISDESRFQVYLESILTKYGKIRQKSQTGSSFFYIMNYGETDANIRVEINTQIWTESLYEIANIYGLELLAQERSTICTNKLVAIMESVTLSGRDLYDIHFFFQNSFPINEALILERTGKNLQDCLVSILNSLENRVKSDTIFDGLEELLDSDQMVLAQEKLFDSLVNILQLQISRI